MDQDMPIILCLPCETKCVKNNDMDVKEESWISRKHLMNLNSKAFEDLYRDTAVNDNCKHRRCSYNGQCKSCLSQWWDKTKRHPDVLATNRSHALTEHRM